MNRTPPPNKKNTILQHLQQFFLKTKPSDEPSQPIVIRSEVQLPQVAADVIKETPIEIGGPKGPEPTRFGDWENKGRCTDF